MQNNNYMVLKVPALNENDSFIRSAIAAFCCNLNPTIEEINDVKTAVSEGFTNAVVHGYGKNSYDKEVIIEVYIYDKSVKIIISDFGKGIEDINQARQPFYTTKPDEERSGMGFTVMEYFMDSLEVISGKEEGTKLILIKKFGEKNK